MSCLRSSLSSTPVSKLLMHAYRPGSSLRPLTRIQLRSCSSRSMTRHAALRPRSPHTQTSNSHLSLLPSAHKRNYASSFLGSGGGGHSIMAAYWVMLGVNAVPFALWQYATATNNTRLQDWWMRNMAVSSSSIREGRWWTCLTSPIAHQSLTHFGFNMFTAHTFCRILTMVPGLTAVSAVTTIFGSAICGSVGYIVSQNYRVNKSQAQGNRTEALRAYHTPAIGASGAVMGLGAVATCFAPLIKMQLMFIPIGIPLWAVTAGYVAFDLYGAGRSSVSRTAHAGHLGGLAFGFVYYLIALKSLAPLGLWTIIQRFLK